MPRPVLSVALLLASTGSIPAAINAAPPQTDPPAAASVSAHVPAPSATAPIVHRTFWGRRLTGLLPVRDGTKLRFSVLLPPGPGPFPTIINYSGYDPGAIGGAAYLADDTAMSVNLDRTLVDHGYAVIGVNARGTGCSQGVFDFLGPAYGRDGHDIVEWVAAQAWSDGAVGMANWSWAGMSQLVTAAERPPHLKALAPGMALGDARLDSWAPGGVPAPRFVAGWWDYLHSRWATVEASAQVEGDDECLAQLDRNRATAEPNRLSNVILQHPLRDAFIEQRHIAARTDRIEVPVLSMEAFQDEAVTSRQGHYHDTLAPERLWLVQTNGGHDLYESTRFRALLVAFFDRFVKGKANGFDAGPHIRVWMESTSQGEGHAREEALRPRYELAFPRFPVPVRPVSLMFDAGGHLAVTSGSGEADSFAYPVPGPAVSADRGPERWGPLAAEWRHGSLAYTTSPLQTPLLAYGSASADLWVSSSTTDADLQATLTEVRPDGQEVFVQRGWLRLSDRALDAARSTPVRPMLLDQPDSFAALTPDEPVLARMEINKLAHAFRPGSRLRLWIETPGLWGGYGFSPQSLPATIRVWHDAAHPSRLVLGTLDPAQVPLTLSPCGTLLGQPCRPDPLAGN